MTVLIWRCETSILQCEKVDSHLYPAVEFEAKAAYKEPLFVIEDNLLMTVLIKGPVVEFNAASE